ncbi:MAG: NAD-dependent epimerase/dehydratase family protein [Anaerolineaceae bacterium]|nr:NAD-dependent epimerase/dehydratase family protein [Anaerolineaceae bacterium]
MSTQTSSDLHVIFGTGPVGMAIMEALRQQGIAHIRMVNRSGKAALPADIELVSGDAADTAFTRQVSAGAAVVYNAVNPPYHQWPELFPALQAGVLAGAASTGAKLVVMDNLYMYGHTGGHPMMESTPHAAHTRKGKVRAQMADDLMAAHRNGQVRVAVGRASDFFGPRGLQSAMGDRVFYAALAGKPASVLGNPDLPHTYSYLPDIGRALALLGQHDAAFGHVWHLPVAESLTTRQFIELIYAELGTQARLSVPPRFAVKLLSFVNPVIREVYEMLYEFEESFVLDDSKFKQAFDFQPTPLREAIQTTIAWFRANPQA